MPFHTFVEVYTQICKPSLEADSHGNVMARRKAGREIKWEGGMIEKKLSSCGEIYPCH